MTVRSATITKRSAVREAKRALGALLAAESALGDVLDTLDMLVNDDDNYAASDEIVTALQPLLKRIAEFSGDFEDAFDEVKDAILP